MNKIAEVLNSQGRSALWLAEQVDVKINTFRNYTSNINQPSLPTLRKIADALDVTIDDLIE